MNEPTDRYQSLLKLTPAQSIAVDVLDAGGTHTEASQAANVNRVTVTRWMHHHPAFIAELNRRRLERANHLVTQTARTTAKAMQLVESAIDGGDIQAALAWLRTSASWTRPLIDFVAESAPAVTPEEVISKHAYNLAMSVSAQFMASTHKNDALREIGAALEE